jgi:hypothetical protein
MKKSQGVKSLEKGREYFLNSLCGKVIFSETVTTRYGSCLTLKLDFESDEKFEEVSWQNIRDFAFIKSGDKIRGFYNQFNQKRVFLEAYEILDESDNVLTRTRKEGYKFVE